MPRQPLAFISYRRLDAPLAAQGLYVQLRARVGPGRVFMDVSSTVAGDTWPERIQQALERATIVLAVVGPDWLRAADVFGRRRLDLPGDWVRTELAYSIRSGVQILPILVGAGTEVPAAEGLPEELRKIQEVTALRLRDERWDVDFSELVAALVGRYGFVDSEQAVMLPQPHVKVPALSAEMLGSELATLSGWEPIESMVPGDYPRSRHELRKTYRFPSFARAVEFMRAAVEMIEEREHHPRWENQWRSVTVHLSTWDVGNRITPLDTQLARELDALFEMSFATKALTQ
jgi:pterin-4a-carbinolamine dehydratase